MIFLKIWYSICSLVTFKSAISDLLSVHERYPRSWAQVRNIRFPDIQVKHEMRHRLDWMSEVWMFDSAIKLQLFSIQTGLSLAAICATQRTTSPQRLEPSKMRHSRQEIKGFCVSTTPTAVVDECLSDPSDAGTGSFFFYSLPTTFKISIWNVSSTNEQR